MSKTMSIRLGIHFMYEEIIEEYSQHKLSALGYSQIKPVLLIVVLLVLPLVYLIQEIGRPLIAELQNCHLSPVQLLIGKSGRHFICVVVC